MLATYRAAVYIPTTIIKPGEGTATTVDAATVQSATAAAARFHDQMLAYSNDRIEMDLTVIPVYEPLSEDQITYRDDAIQWFISPGKVATLRGEYDDYDLFVILTPDTMVNATTFNGIATSDGFWANIDDARIDDITPHEFAHWIGIWLDSQGYTNWPTCPDNTTISGIHCATHYGYTDDLDPAWLKAFFTGTISDGSGVTDAALALSTPTQAGVKTLPVTALTLRSPMGLFTPDGSRNRDGSVEPTVVGTVPSVQGQYGPAWDATTLSSNRVFVARSAYINDAEGTLLVRCQWTAAANYDSFPISLGNSTNLLLGRRGGGGQEDHVYAAFGSSGGETLTTVPDDTPVTLALRWSASAGETTAWWNGHIIARFPYAAPSASATFYLAKADTRVEGVLVYDAAIPDADMQRISTMPRQWTWENAQHIARTPRTLTWNVRIDGVPVPSRACRTTHDVDNPVATGSVTLKAPIDAHIGIGSEVTIDAGYDGASLPIFRGRIPEYDGAFSDRGGEVTIDLEGHGSLLMYEHDVALGVQGPLRFFSWWRSICAYIGVEDYWADEVTDVDGFDIMLGANEHINDGIVIIPATTSPGEEMARRARLIGYRHFETPTYVRLMRISGLPTDPVESLIKFEEGVNCREVRRVESQSPMANYWDIWGAEYTDDTDAEVVIHSFPAVVTTDPLFGPTGIKREEIRDAALDTFDLADACRNSHEVDYTELSSRWTWQTRGDPERTPGEQVALSSPSVGPQVEVAGVQVSFPVGLWLTHVTHDISDRGWTTTMEGWQGAGQALPAGTDCATQNLVTGPIHLGNETLSYYAVPSPNGSFSDTEHRVAFSVAFDYTTLTLRGFAHGSNSFLNADSTASRFEIWQGGERKGSGDLPVLGEHPNIDYSDYSNWSSIVIPLSGSLLAGSAELRVIAGEDTDVGDVDDFEFRNVTITTCGIGLPVVVGGS